MPNEVLYHGSPKRFRRLEPKSHYLADHRPVVFATPLREIALASLQPWNDDIFEQGVVGEDPPYMMELQPNAFRDVYGGKRGYLYTLAPDTFYHTNRLTRFEQISDVSPEILDVEVIEDALSALQNSNMQMIYFEDAEAFRMNDYRQNPYSRHADSLYVLSAVPPNSNRLLRKYGLLSGIETIKHPDVLEAARPDVKQRRAFVKKVKEVIASDRPHSVMGPSVFFTPPDPEKITNKHFIKKWDLQTIRIDLGRLIEDYPDTIVWGAELLPYDKAWRKMSDEEFDDVMADMGYASWEDFAAERSRALTLDEVREFTQMRPEDLWEYYAKSDAGKMYASNVPHAFVITPMGYIPYEYIEYVDEARGNPRAAPLPYDLIHNVASTISQDLTQYASEGSLQDEVYFIVDLTGERYADGSLIQDRSKLLVIVHLMTSENREQLENELGWPIYPQQGEFLIKDAAGLLRGNLTDTNEPVYLLHLYLNGEVDVQDAQVNERDLYHLLIHEWTHLRDRPFRRDREWSFEDPEDFRNMPHEVSAYLQQIVHDVTTHRQAYIENFESKHNGIVEFLGVYSPEWREIEASLSRKNRKRVLNAVYTALYESGD